MRGVRQALADGWHARRDRHPPTRGAPPLRVPTASLGPSRPTALRFVIRPRGGQRHSAIAARAASSASLRLSAAADSHGRASTCQRPSRAVETRHPGRSPRAIIRRPAAIAACCCRSSLIRLASRFSLGVGPSPSLARPRSRDSRSRLSPCRPACPGRPGRPYLYTNCACSPSTLHSPVRSIRPLPSVGATS